MLSSPVCDMLGDMKKSMPLIFGRVRRVLFRKPNNEPRSRKRQAPRLVVLPEDSIWPSLHNYPYSSAA
jgi:hypothetical protein